MRRSMAESHEHGSFFNISTSLSAYYLLLMFSRTNPAFLFDLPSAGQFPMVFGCHPFFDRFVGSCKRNILWCVKLSSSIAIILLTGTVRASQDPWKDMKPPSSRLWVRMSSQTHIKIYWGWALTRRSFCGGWKAISAMSIAPEYAQWSVPIACWTLWRCWKMYTRHLLWKGRFRIQASM